MRHWLRQVVENEQVRSTDAPPGVIDPFDGSCRTNPPHKNDSSLLQIQAIDSKWEGSFPELRWRLVPEVRQPLRLVLDTRSFR